MHDTTFTAFVPPHKVDSTVPVVLFQSGHGSNSACHAPLMNALASEGFVCVLPDRDTDTLNTPDGGAAVTGWWKAREGSCTVLHDLRTATIVGEGIAEQAPMWDRALDALAGVDVQSPALVGNAWGLTAHVPVQRLDDVVRAFHAALPD